VVNKNNHFLWLEPRFDLSQKRKGLCHSLLLPLMLLMLLVLLDINWNSVILLDNRVLSLSGIIQHMRVENEPPKNCKITIDDRSWRDKMRDHHDGGFGAMKKLLKCNASKY
jgi:hypothetical protein